ncbi:type IV pilin [Halovenus sp. WSH3]|uniref:Type IV pilin n=1 Tax=Halovenus carboxidivorans TaxID=2692199 RepID=A0A6B0T4Y4_9EURY|nr:type IV pilin [Halovenus carboxidivorans]
MVAITVILAAVIASFVLGLGGNNEPAPQPTIESSLDNSTGNVTLSVTGGDAFEAGVVTLEGEIDGETLEAELDGTSTSEISAGDDIVIDLDDSAGTGSPSVFVNGEPVGATSIPSNTDLSTADWELELVWNPADQNSQIIYSDSS